MQSSITSSVILERKKEIVHEYPWIGQANDLSEAELLIVLFSEPNAGVVVHSNLDRWEVGEANEGWDESKFDIFEGEVTLKQSM